MIEEGFKIGLGIALALGVLSVLPILLVLAWAFRWPILIVMGLVLLAVAGRT
jgi:hypothetical protein